MDLALIIGELFYFYYSRQRAILYFIIFIQKVTIIIEIKVDWELLAQVRFPVLYDIKRLKYLTCFAYFLMKLFDLRSY